jgi:hypothetical protein
MPSDKPPTARPSVSFNMWLSLQKPDGPYGELAQAWKTTRGRLTRATVVERAGAAGVLPHRAGAAYDEYCTAVGLPVAAVA